MVLVPGGAMANEAAVFRVLGRPSSINVRKVIWTAAETGVAFVNEAEWGATRGTTGDDYVTLNPNARVPVLVGPEGVLWESNPICRYLAAYAGRTDLLPATPFARAEVEKWMDWQANELNPAWRVAFLALVRRRPDQLDDLTAIARSADQWNQLMLILEDRLTRTGAYVTGPDFTVADIVLGLSLQRWLLTPITRPATPALLAYRARMQARPAARQWIDPDLP